MTTPRTPEQAQCRLGVGRSLERFRQLIDRPDGRYPDPVALTALADQLRAALADGGPPEAGYLAAAATIFAKLAVLDEHGTSTFWLDVATRLVAKVDVPV